MEENLATDEEILEFLLWYFYLDRKDVSHKLEIDEGWQRIRHKFEFE